MARLFCYNQGVLEPKKFKPVPEGRILLSVGQYADVVGIGYASLRARLQRLKHKWWYPGLIWVKVSYAGRPQRQRRIPKWSRPLTAKQVCLAKWIAEGKTIKELQLLLRPKGRNYPIPRQDVWQEVRKLDELVQDMTKLGAKWPVKLPKGGYEWP